MMSDIELFDAIGWLHTGHTVQASMLLKTRVLEQLRTYPEQAVKVLTKYLKSLGIEGEKAIIEFLNAYLDWI